MEHLLEHYTGEEKHDVQKPNDGEVPINDAFHTSQDSFQLSARQVFNFPSGL